MWINKKVLNPFKFRIFQLFFLCDKSHNVDSDTKIIRCFLSREILGNSRIVENWGKYIDIITYFSNLCTFKGPKKRANNTKKLLLEKVENALITLRFT